MIDTQNDDDDARPGVEQSVLTERPPVLPDAAPGAKKKWWARLLPGCPLPHVTLGTVTFHGAVEVHGEDGRVVELPGQILELSDADVDLVREQLQEVVLRSFYFVNEKGQRIRRGQTLVSTHRWERPGTGQNGAPFAGPDGKPIVEKRLVQNPGARTSPNDEPLAKWCMLVPATRETETMFSHFSARARNAAERIEEARRYNAEQVDREKTLAEEAGARGRSTVMAREP